MYIFHTTSDISVLAMVADNTPLWIHLLQLLFLHIFLHWPNHDISLTGGNNKRWKFCLVGRRFTSPAESRYAHVEGEALAVAYDLHQTLYYILGCPNLIVTTDHKPLSRILNDRSLTDIANRRLLNLKEKNSPLQF